MVTDQQVQLMRSNMINYRNQRIAAAKSGMSERTARKYLKANALPSELKKRRHWRTRPDLFHEVWSEVETMLSLTPGLYAPTILSYLMEKYPNKFKRSNLRALQRRIQLWRSEKGPDKEIIFPQNIPPGRQSQSDYTCMNKLKITINGVLFPHLLYHFMLPYSLWEDASVCFSESFDSLSQGYEQAVWKLGKVASEHRTDNQGAVAYFVKGERIFTERWQEFMNHYGTTASCNNPGKGQENGSVEKSHDLLKKAVDQQLLLRGSRDFTSQQEYEEFVQSVINMRNEARQVKLAHELPLLKGLPYRKYHAPIMTLVKVSRASTVRLQKGTYSVASRLIGYQLKAYIYPTYIELYYGRRLVQRMDKLASTKEFAIDYRHVIHQLVRKPGAFERYQYREDLFPRVIFRKAYDAYKKASAYKGHKHYLKVLQLAALHGESKIAELLEESLGKGSPPEVEDLKKKLSVRTEPFPYVYVKDPQLQNYDVLLH